jgi:hypothetical protein
LKRNYTKGTTLSTSTRINTVRFTYEQVIIDDPEDNLQRGKCTLNSIAETSGTEISREISEKMAFLGEDPVRCKIFEDVLQLVKKFKYLYCEIS